MRPKRLEYDDAVEFSEGEGPEEELQDSGDSEVEETGSEDEDLFRGKYAREKDATRTKDDAKPASKPIEDASAAPSSCSPWDSLPAAIRVKLQQISADLLDLLPASECT